MCWPQAPQCKNPDTRREHTLRDQLNGSLLLPLPLVSILLLPPPPNFFFILVPLAVVLSRGWATQPAARRTKKTRQIKQDMQKLPDGKRYRHNTTDEQSTRAQRTSHKHHSAGPSAPLRDSQTSNSKERTNLVRSGHTITRSDTPTVRMSVQGDQTSVSNGFD